MKRRLLFKIVWGLAMTLAIWIAIAPFLARALVVEKPLERADVILILAGSAEYRPRVARAAEIYRQGIAPFIVLTDDGRRGSWNRAEQRNPPFVELAKKELISNGVPAENIEILPGIVDGTIDEAQALRDVLPEKNWKFVLIVTSDYHTRRALRTFESVMADSGVEFGIAYAATDEKKFPKVFWWLSPEGRKTVGGEYAKSIYYWFYY